MSKLAKHRLSSDAIAIINPGSSSLKCACLSKTNPADEIQRQYETDSLKDSIISFLTEFPAAFCCIRFVHGGPVFSQPVLVDQHVFNQLDKLSDFAPLHNPVSLECLSIVRAHFPDINLIAMFDTEFFHAMPPVAQAYGLPFSLQNKHQIRRYGFHGFAHAGMLRDWNILAPQHDNDPSSLVTIQLGSGCSMAAIENSKAIDTSMGFTPNEGLLMSTRSGDIDPGLVTWLQKKEHWSADAIDDILNQQSGWSGMSQLGSNMGDLLQSELPAASLAIALFCYRIRKTLGAYFAILGKLDGVMFSGGIAEHSPSLCLQILTDLQHLGINTMSESTFTQAPAKSLEKNPIRISSDQSAASCWVVKASENAAMVDSLIKSRLTSPADN